MSARACPYARLNRDSGLDYAVGERVVSCAAVHGGREGAVVRPLRSEPGRYAVLLDGDAAPVGVDPAMMARLSPSLRDWAEALGLAVVSSHRDLPGLVVRGADGRLRREPQARDLVARDGGGLVVWRAADRDSAVDGWDATRDSGVVPTLSGWMVSGRSTTLDAALGWYARALDVAAGRAADFGGC